MFTGLIQTIGSIRRLTPAGEASGRSLRIDISSPDVAGELAVDDSVAVNGVCQTVTRVDGGIFSVTAVEETLRKTTFGSLKEGEEVNIELAMKLQDRLGGHMVLGHVDAAVEIIAFRKEGESWLLSVKIPSEFLKYVIPVGSIALDGISLTVARLDGPTVTSAIIPHTYEHTVVKHYRAGKMVNVEFDILGKYIDRHLAARGAATPQGLSVAQLIEQGF